MNCETMGGNLGFVQIACKILLDSFGSMASTVGLLSIGILFFFSNVVCPLWFNRLEVLSIRNSRVLVVP
jgi:hypothetical protein